MALLPCLRWGDARWWMPLDAATADCLGQWVLRAAAEPAFASSAQAAAVIRRRLERDPALFIYASLRWLESHPQRIASAVTTARLARWMRDQWSTLFASGDAMLGAPAVHSEHLRRWGQLRQRCLTQDHTAWLDGAAAWLEVAGPPVPVAWRASWPQVVLAPRTPRDRQDDRSRQHEPDGDAAAETNRAETNWAETNHAEAAAAAQQDPAQATADVLGEVVFPLAELSLPMLTRLAQQQRALQQRFDRRLQQQKLASLKQLAYGLSHEINNPLANIASRARQLARGERDPQRVASIDRLVDQAMRAHEMIADMMFFAHPPRPQKQRVSVAEVVDQVVREQRPALAAVAIELQWAEPADRAASLVRADRSMLTDALRALLRNAAEAIGCGGRIAVTLRKRGRAQLIEIADSGPGLSDSARRHAFDPYFSGREAGRGLGLGLCRVYRVAKLHRGGVSLSGGPAGCVARLWLPRPARHPRGDAKRRP